MFGIMSSAIATDMFTIDAKDRQYLDGTEFSSIYQFFLKGASGKNPTEWLGKLLEGKSMIASVV